MIEKFVLFRIEKLFLSEFYVGGGRQGKTVFSVDRCQKFIEKLYPVDSRGLLFIQ